MTDIKALVEKQLGLINNPIIKTGLESILTEPFLHLRDWDYGFKGEQLECWTIAVEKFNDTSIVYSESGFGPKRPWGLVFTSKPWIGMDSGWFDNLEDCFLESHLAGSLPIWCLEKENEFKSRETLEENITIDKAFEIRDNLMTADKKTRYHIEPRKNNSA